MNFTQPTEQLAMLLKYLKLVNEMATPTKETSLVYLLCVLLFCRPKTENCCPQRKRSTSEILYNSNVTLDMLCQDFHHCFVHQAAHGTEQLLNVNVS